MPFDKQISIPVYVQLRTIFRNAILSGQWAPGSQVPSEMALCEQYNVSRPTLRKAMDGLVEEGLLIRNRPIGTFVAEREEKPSSASAGFGQPAQADSAMPAPPKQVFLQEKAPQREITLSLEESMLDTFLQYSLWSFEKEHSIHVRLVHSGDWRENMSSIVNYALDKTLPDIFWVSGVVVPMFARCGLIRPVNEFLSDQQRLRIQSSDSVQRYRMYCYNGQLYGFPLFSETRLLFYRKDHLRQLGIPERIMQDLSHDSFLELCRTLTCPRENRWGFAGQMGYNADTLQNAMTFIIQRGGQLYREHGGRLRAATSEPAFVDAFRWYTDLLSVHGVCPPLRKYPHYQDISAWFMRGTISMAVERPTLAMIMSQMHELDDRWGVAPMPAGPANGCTFLGGVPLCISSQCKDPQAAWLLIRHLTDERVNFPYLKRIGFLPPIELYDDEPILRQFPACYHPFVQAMHKAVPFSYPLPQNVLGVEMEEWNKPLQQMLRQVVRGETAVEKATDYLTWMIDSLLKMYQ